MDGWMEEIKSVWKDPATTRSEPHRPSYGPFPTKSIQKPSFRNRENRGSHEIPRKDPGTPARLCHDWHLSCSRSAVRHLAVRHLAVRSNLVEGPIGVGI